jgi:hypothetical protein
MPNSGRQDDIASLTVRSGFRRWPWPSPFFRDDEPDIVGLITDNGDKSPEDALRVLQDGGISVSRVVTSETAGTADAGAGPAAPPISLLWSAAKELGKNNSVPRFPRTRLMARLAELDLSSADEVPVTVLRRKLRQIWSEREGPPAPQENGFVVFFDGLPFPLSLVGRVAGLLIQSRFRLWFLGVPGLGPGCRWLRRQRRSLLPAEAFETFLLRMTARSADADLLAVRAFLEDLRVAYRPRMWNWRKRNRRPVLILDNQDNSLPNLFDNARKYARRHGARPDPLLIVVAPWSEDRPHDFGLRRARHVGKPAEVHYPGPHRPRRALLAFGLMPLCAAAAALIVMLGLIGILPPWPGSPARAAAGSRCRATGGQDAETVLTTWRDHAGESECVGFSASSYVFRNPEAMTSQQQKQQESRMTYVQGQIHALNMKVDKTAEEDRLNHLNRPLLEIAYFAGLTESPSDQYDSAEAEEMEGLLAAQRSVINNTEDPLLKVIVANGGAKMQDAEHVAKMIIKQFRGDSHFLGVVGLDRSVGYVRRAIQDFSSAKITMLATTLSADGIGGGSPNYFSLSPSNMQEARLMLKYVQDAVPHYFGEARSIYPSDGFATAQKIVVWEPTVITSPQAGSADLYIYTLVNDLTSLARKTPGLPPLTVTSDLDSSVFCGADQVDIYAGRHDSPLDSAGQGKNDDFTRFMTRVWKCKNQIPFVIADDGVSRFVSDPADRNNLGGSPGTEPYYVAYVTKGISVLRTGTECLNAHTAAAVVAQPLGGFCAQYARIATALSKRGVRLLWTGERVGLAWDAAQMFLQAAEAYQDNGEVITRGEVPGAFESVNPGFSLVTGSVSFGASAATHVGADSTEGMPLAIVRILISNPNAAPVCEFSSLDDYQLGPITSSQKACIIGPG